MISSIVWDIQPNLQIGSYSLHLYSLFFALGLLFGGFVVISLMKNYNTSQTYFIYAFAGIIVGARLFHCLCYEPSYYFSHPLQIFIPYAKIDGHWVLTGFNGLASHGGTIGLMIALFIYAKRNNIKYMQVFDVFAVATPLTGAFIRLGNLMNSEILGKPADLSFAFIFKNIDFIPRHPAQLYEALWYFMLFAVIFWIYKKTGYKKYKSGFYTGCGLVGVALFRFFIEFLKENQETFHNTLPINMGQILSIPFIIAGIWLICRSVK